MSRQTESIVRATGYAALSVLGLAMGCAGASSHPTQGSGLGVVSARNAGNETETPIALGDLPPAVREALAAITSDDRVKQVTRDEERGVTTYDVEYDHGGARWAAEFATDGTVLENEPDNDDGPDDPHEPDDGPDDDED